MFDSFQRTSRNNHNRKKGITVLLTLDEAERFVNNNEFAWWNGWDLVVWKHTHRIREFDMDALYNRKYRGKQKWGLAKTVQPSPNGTYRIPKNYVKPTSNPKILH